MKKVLKIGIIFCLLFVFLIVGVFFWAKSPVFSDNEYNQTLYFENAKFKLPQGDTISVMSYNIGYLSGMTNNQPVRPTREFYQENEKAVIERLKEIDVDIIGTQEIDYNSNRSYYLNQNEFIASQLYPYSVAVVNWDKHYVPFPFESYKLHFGRMLSGESILSKFPLEDAERLVLSRVASLPFYYQAIYLDRILQVVKVKHPKRDFIFMNLHAEAFDLETREEQLNFVYDKFIELSKDNGVILVGDFNSDLKANETAFHQFLNNKNIGSSATSDAQNTPYSFPSDQPIERLDYIFYTHKDFDLIEGRILNEFGTISDHLPCYAKLIIK